jgi:hypothetical protein
MFAMGRKRTLARNGAFIAPCGTRLGFASLARQGRRFGSAILGGRTLREKHRRHFRPGSIEIAAERRIGVQAGYRRRRNHPPRVNVALPVRIANEAALSKFESTLKDGVRSAGIQLRQDQRKPPADCAVAGRVRPILAKQRLILWVASRFIVNDERPNALVMILCPKGRKANVDQRPAEQAVETGRGILPDYSELERRPGSTRTIDIRHSTNGFAIQR